MVCFFQSDNQRIIAVDSRSELSQDTLSKLTWLFGNAEKIEKDTVKGHFIGPRREMITPWSTNAVEITQNMGIKGIVRIEEFQRVESKKAPYDPMLQNRYENLDQKVFTVDRKPEPLRYIDDIEAYNLQEGLALPAETPEQKAHKIATVKAIYESLNIPALARKEIAALHRSAVDKLQGFDPQKREVLDNFAQKLVVRTV